MGSSKSVSSQAKREFWEKHLREWKESTLSQVGYCRGQGISIKSFVYWKNRLSEAGAAVTLVELAVSKSCLTVLPERTPLRLRITDAYWIEIQKDFDPESLNRLIDVLERR